LKSLNPTRRTPYTVTVAYPRFIKQRLALP
jgi:hypothetical protein